MPQIGDRFADMDPLAASAATGQASFGARGRARALASRGASTSFTGEPSKAAPGQGGPSGDSSARTTRGPTSLQQSSVAFDPRLYRFLLPYSVRYTSSDGYQTHTLDMDYWTSGYDHMRDITEVRNFGFFHTFA